MMSEGGSAVPAAHAIRHVTGSESAYADKVSQAGDENIHESVD